MIMMYNSKNNNENGKNKGDEAIEQVRLTRLHPSYSSNGTSFNIHEGYQHAIDRLIECNVILTSLQKQLASKDKQIQNLEERLVTMSVELASSKALEDEHRLLKRQMDAMNETNKSYSNSSNNGGLDTDFPPSARINKQQEQLQRAQSLKLDSTPDISADANAPFIRAARRNTAIDTSSSHRKLLAQSLKLDTSDANNTLFVRDGRRNTAIDTTDHNRKPLRHFSAGTLMVRRSKSIAHGSSNKNKKHVIGRGSTRGSRGSISSAVELQRSSHDRSSRPLLTKQGASRRLSHLGSYLLGLGRNSEEDDANIEDPRHHQNLPRKRSRSNRLESSTGSLISAVVFPATSREVLASCLDGEAWGNNANAEWADF